MRVVTVTHNPIAPHIDRDTVLQVKARFLQLNQLRLEQAKQYLNPRQQQCIEVLPLLFHFNHPRLPGYQHKVTPAGFANYTPSAAQIQAATTLAKSFKPPSSTLRKFPLLAIYVMGSTGTVAQSNKSDMDFWLCHTSDLDAKALKDLENKCESISAWAREFDLDWHFFLMQPEAFRQGEHGRLSKEGSGSSQHFLLLDEFYRSAILLAGQLPMWWFINNTDEESYRETKSAITERGFLRPQEWLDFGPIGNVPPSEFVSAAVWQLYKSISSPFKSLLKLLILEVYLSKYPKIFTLADQMKLRIYAGQFNATSLDPYLMLLKELTDYFIERREFDRLEQMRLCFYFKLQKPYTAIMREANSAVLLQCLDQWQWQPMDFTHIDNSENWNAQQVMYERRKVIKDLTSSYRLLLENARRAEPSINVNSQEITILGRKLHATFERSPGKIEFINPAISQDIGARYLLITKTPEIQEWHAYLTNNRWEKSRTPLISCSSLTELFCWCIFNKVLTTNTRMATKQCGEFENSDAQRLLRLFEGLNVEQYLAPNHNAFLEPARIAFLVICINDPSTTITQKKFDSDSVELDPLNTALGSLAENFCAITINTWGEVRVQTLGCELTNVVEWLLAQSSPSLQIAVRSLSIHNAALIEKRLLFICQQLQALVASDASVQTPHKQLLLAANHQYLLCFFQQGWKVSLHSSSEALWHKLARPLSQSTALLVDAESLTYLQTHEPDLLQLASLSGNTIHIVYRLSGSMAVVYCKDERGSLVRFEQPFHSEAALLKPLHHFCRNVLSRNPIASNHSLFGIYPIEFHEILCRGKTHRLERRHATSDIGNLRLFELRFCIESLDIELAPANWQLSAWLNGERMEPQAKASIFQTAAKQILTYRQSNQRYPCYITDLDLSLCEHQLPHFGQLQTSHFLHIKVALEQALNAALANL